MWIHRVRKDIYRSLSTQIEIILGHQVLSILDPVGLQLLVLSFSCRTGGRFGLGVWESTETPGTKADHTVLTDGLNITLPETNMEVENHLFVVENGLPRGHSPLPRENSCLHHFVLTIPEHVFRA